MRIGSFKEYAGVVCANSCRSLLDSDHTPLRRSQMLVDTAFERGEAGLFNAVSTSARKPHSGEWLAFKSELESAGIMM